MPTKTKSARIEVRAEDITCTTCDAKPGQMCKRRPVEDPDFKGTHRSRSTDAYYANRK